MQRLPSKGKSSRPQAIQTSKSFSRYEPPETLDKTRSRASTLQQSPAQILENPLNVEPIDSTSNGRSDGDIFERPNPDGSMPEESADGDTAVSFEDGYEELPIEIQSLMERFLESLALKHQPTPLSMDRLSELYQDFYEHAQSQINIHIATLATRLSREQSPSPSISSARSMASRGGTRKNSRPLEKTISGDPLAAQHQMLTATEITDKRKARRQLEVKRVAMEEALERGVCEKVYPRIWRHGSTDDEARDEKLRSRAAALSVVGVDLKELLSSALSENVTVTEDLTAPEEGEASSPRALLSSARESLQSMNTERFPRGKLDHLTAVHKHIVEALQQMFPSTSSADEVLPTLIYTIITTPPEANSVVSNFNFIQRFRSSSKLDGEAAYCLTNLEAAITFLETVDLSSIRPEEGPQGRAKSSSRPSTPQTEISDPMYRGLPGDTSSPAPVSMPTAKITSLVSSRPRTLSTLMQSRPRTFETASGVVMHGADAAFDNIHNALDGGFKFLFGRMKERQAASPNNSPSIAAPKTLEDARRLISPAAPAGEDDATSIGESAIPEPAGDTGEDLLKKPEDKIIGMIGGRRNSTQSTDSNRSVGPMASRKLTATQGKAPASVTASMPQAGSYAAVESMRNLGNTLNPLKGFTGIGMMRGFGRSSSPVVSSPGTNADDHSSLSGAANAPGTASPSALSDRQADEKSTGFSWESVAPPIQKFVELKEAKEMNFYDVELLLRDYQRLAGAFYASRAA